MAPAAPWPVLLVDNIIPTEIRDRIDCSIPMGRGHKIKETCHRPARQRCAPVKEIIENTSYGIENNDFSSFFILRPVVRRNETPDRPDTTHLGRAPDARQNQAGQPGRRRALRKITNLRTIFRGSRAPFVLTIVNQNGGSWRGLEILFFSCFFHSKYINFQ